MFKNYFYLHRAVIELNEFLKECIIIDIFSQERNILFLKIPSISFPERHLLISVNPQSPYLLIKNDHRKAKRNVVHFFNESISESIVDLEMAAYDRLIKVNLKSSKLIISFRGNKSNIFYINNDNEESQFKKSNFPISPELSKLQFVKSFLSHPINSDESTYNDIAELKNKYQMISSEIKNELSLRSSNSGDSLRNFKKLANEIITQDIRVELNNDLDKIIFVPDSFSSIEPTKEPKIFKTYSSALQFYIKSHYKHLNKKENLNELYKYFNKELSSLANKLTKLKSRLETGSNEKKYYEYGNLLLAHIYNLRKGMDEITLPNFNTNENIIIKLNTKLSPQENINKYFEKASDEKVNYNKSLELFNFTKDNYDKLKIEHDIFLNSSSTKEISEIYGKIIPGKKKIIKMDSGLKFKYWHYVIEEKYNVYIGRDSKSNDYLSVKFAKQNDYWLHARGLPGSHVVLRVENVKEGVPKNILKKTAALAAYHSKGKTAGTISVSYTFAKFVYKKKGMTPGKVFLTKEKTLLVKPEIPKNCELVNE